MSTYLMGLCWPLQMAATDKSVLMSLADQANDAGVCWPSVGTICRRTCLCERAVQYSIKSLCGSGILTINRSPGRSTNFQINPASAGAGTPSLFDAPRRGDNGRGVQGVHPAGRAPGGASRAPTPAGDAPRTVINRQEPKTHAPVALVGLEAVPANLMTDWKRVRKSKRLADLTQTGLDAFLAEVAKTKHTAESAVKLCIGEGWGGLKASWIGADGLTPKDRSQLGAAAPTFEHTEWFETEKGANARAKELGLPPWDQCIPFTAFVANVRSHEPAQVNG